MHIVLGVIAAVGSILLIVGALTGRIQVRSCCSSPEHDLRMRQGD